MARILVISCTTYGQNSRVKCHAEALVGHGDEVDVLCLENQRSVRSNGVNLIGLVRPRHRSMRGLCYVQFSISAAFNAVRFSLRRRYDVVVVYAMRTATILCAAPLRLLGSRITLDLGDETAEAHQKEKAGGQGALRGRLLVMEEAIRARFANRVNVAHAIHRQLLRNLKIFGSGASNTTRILRSGIPACSEGSADSLGWDKQQRQLLEAVDSLLEKETEARPASESSSGVGWRRVEWLGHGRQIGWAEQSMASRETDTRISQKYRYRSCATHSARTGGCHQQRACLGISGIQRMLTRSATARHRGQIARYHSRLGPSAGRCGCGSPGLQASVAARQCYANVGLPPLYHPAVEPHRSLLYQMRFPASGFSRERCQRRRGEADRRAVQSRVTTRDEHADPATDHDAQCSWPAESGERDRVAGQESAPRRLCRVN